jgi:hypothetical protein
MILCSAMLLRDSESGAGKRGPEVRIENNARRLSHSTLLSLFSEILPTKNLAPTCT